MLALCSIGDGVADDRTTVLQPRSILDDTGLAPVERGLSDDDTDPREWTELEAATAGKTVSSFQAEVDVLGIAGLRAKVGEERADECDE